MTNTGRAAKTIRYGKTIPGELRWLRTVGTGEKVLGSMYSANQVRQLVHCGGLVATTTPGLFIVGTITDEMIAATQTGA